MKSAGAECKRERGINNEDCSQTFITCIPSSPFDKNKLRKKYLLAHANIAF